MPRGGKRKGAGRPKFNDDNPTSNWVVYNVMLEIDRDAPGRYQRKMAKESTFSKVKKVGTPIEAAALVAIRETVELKEEAGRLKWEIENLKKLHPGVANIGQLSDDLEQTRYFAVPDAWKEKSKDGGIRVYIEGGIQPNHLDMSRYFQNVAKRSKECPTGPENGMDKNQIKELWNRRHEADRKLQIKGDNT